MSPLFKLHPLSRKGAIIGRWNDRPDWCLMCYEGGVLVVDRVLDKDALRELVLSPV